MKDTQRSTPKTKGRIMTRKKTLPAAKIPEPLRILSIGAHPADIFDQSGGTMAHHVARGDWVGCCVLTHGARVHDQVISEAMFHRRRIPQKARLGKLMDERADVKAAEVRRACGVLGVKDIYFFGADDAVLLPTEEHVKRLARLIRELKPEIILTHFPHESGGIWNPHAAAGHIVMLAVGCAQAVEPGDRNPPHRVAQIFFWGQGAAHLATHVFDAARSYYNDVFIDITDVVEKKLACMDLLVSQGYGGAYARKRIEISDGAFGRGGRVAYAEAFISHTSQTYRYLPLSDYTRQFARDSDHEIMARYSYRVKT
jgi:4-oxalomesaconate hydratase